MSELVLALDAAGSACSAAVAVGGALRAAQRVATAHGHAELLLPLIDAVMREAGAAPPRIDVVAATVGPGGFTGLRVGLAAARGIALATGARLVGVTGFAAVAALLPPADAATLVAIESRREELYVQLFDEAGRPLTEPLAAAPAALPGLIEAAVGSAPLAVAGDAATRAQAALGRRPRVELVAASAPDALGVLRAVQQGRHDAIGAAARPLYLRPPDTTAPQPRAPAGEAPPS